MNQHVVGLRFVDRITADLYFKDFKGAFGRQSVCLSKMNDFIEVLLKKIFSFFNQSFKLLIAFFTVEL